MVSLDGQQNTMAGFLCTFDQSHTLNSCMIHEEQKYCLHFQLEKNMALEREQTTTRVISLTAERNVCVAPF